MVKLTIVLFSLFLHFNFTSGLALITPLRQVLDPEMSCEFMFVSDSTAEQQEDFLWKETQTRYHIVQQFRIDRASYKFSSPNQYPAWLKWVNFINQNVSSLILMDGENPKGMMQAKRSLMKMGTKCWMVMYLSNDAGFLDRTFHTGNRVFRTFRRVIHVLVSLVNVPLLSNTSFITPTKDVILVHQLRRSKVRHIMPLIYSMGMIQRVSYYDWQNGCISDCYGEQTILIRRRSFFSFPYAFFIMN